MDALLSGRLRDSVEMRELGAAGRHLLGCAVEVPTNALHSTMVVILAAPDLLLPPPGDLKARFGLTEREAEVALLLASQCSDKEIAQRLSVTIHTAERHTEHILGKLGIHSRRAVRNLLALVDPTH